MLVACCELSSKPSALVYPANSDFDKNIKKVERFVRAVIDSEGTHGLDNDSPASLYVCGGPGLGKTAGVRACCERLTMEHVSDGDTDLRRPIVCYINANLTQMSLDPMGVVLQRMAETIGMKDFQGSSFKSIKANMSRKQSQLILVVDELDMLLSEQESSETLSKQEETLEALAMWAKDPDVPLSLIGISNRKGNVKYERLIELGEVRHQTVAGLIGSLAGS